jgi:hypothetical protein
MPSEVHFRNLTYYNFFKERGDHQKILLPSIPKPHHLRTVCPNDDSSEVAILSKHNGVVYCSFIVNGSMMPGYALHHAPLKTPTPSLAAPPLLATLFCMLIEPPTLNGTTHMPGIYNALFG